MEDGVFSTPGQQPEPKVAQDTDKNQTKSKKGRVIIRNLVFDVNETHLKKLFQKYGQINDIKIPINPATNKTKGFAFIELENRNKALKAIKELNESKYKGRTILLDLAVEKAKFETKKNPGKKDSNKDQNEKGPKNQRVSSIRNDDDMEEEEEEEDEDFEGEEEEDDEEDFDEEEDDEEEDEEEKQKKEEEKQKKEDLSSTIFVRNISYEVGQSEFKDFFQKFGKLHYAKLVINRETETHNGTGFVKFNSPAIAQKLVDESKKLEDGLAVLKGESSGVSDVSLELGGRRMIVLPALGKRDVESLKASKKEKDQENAPKNQNTLEYWIHNDRHKKRNIYLANSGLNDPKDTLNALDKKKFEDNFKEKIEKIKNPNYCISTTRVIFKNLPKHDFDEQDIREVILKVLSQKYEQKIIKTTRLVSKIAVIREKERQDSEGNQRSRGYGFAEFTRHEDALFFLSKIKDNYKLISDRMPIVEFAIEDIRELRKRERLLKKLQSKKVEVKTDDDAKKKKKEELANKEEKNAEKLARLRISQLLEQNDTTAKTYAEIKDLMKKVKSRGLKQRLNNKVNAKFPSGGEQKKSKEKVAKPVKAIEVKPGQSRLEAKMEKRKEEKNQKRLNKIAESNAKVNEEMTEEENEAMLIKNIRRMIKNSKRSKRRAEERDEFDDIADAYQRKVQKL